MSFVSLKKWEHQDAKSLYAFSNTPHIAQFMRNDFAQPFLLQDAVQFISHVLVADDYPTCYRAIVYKGEVVGSIALFVQDGIHRYTAQIGYWLCESLWGKGIMTDAILQMCSLAFEEFNLIRVYAQVFEKNTSSQKALEKAGFNYELKKRRAVYKEALYHDLLIYAKTR